MDKTYNVGERISELMDYNNINSKTLANAISVDVTTVNRWKRNAKMMRLSQILKLADYFACSIEFILARTDIQLDYTPQVCPPFYYYFRQLLTQKDILPTKINAETTIKSSHFDNWKKGSDPHILSLIELADYLNVTIDYLVGRER